MLKFSEYTPELLSEKLIMFNQGKKYGQIVFVMGGAGCFDGETLVHTENGHKPISNITVGEKVWTFNEETGNKELKEVLETPYFSEHPEQILEIEFDTGDVVTCTANHEFYIDGEWVQAKDL